MGWHPTVTHDLADRRAAELRVVAARAHRPSPRFREGLAGTLRLLADRLDGSLS